MVVVTLVSSQTATQSGRQNAHSHGVPLPLQKPEGQYETLIHFVQVLQLSWAKIMHFNCVLNSVCGRLRLQYRRGRQGQTMGPSSRQEDDVH